MSSGQTKKNIDVRITYSAERGCAFKAVMLARDFEHRFDIPVNPVLRDDGIFEVIVNGTSIYKHQGECDSIKANEVISNAIRNHKDPVRVAVDSDSARENEDDPDYREWMRCICSGD